MASCSLSLIGDRGLWIQQLMNLANNKLPIIMPHHLGKFLDEFPCEVQTDCIYLYHVCKYTQRGIYNKDKWNLIPNCKFKEELEKKMYHQCLEFNRKYFKSSQGPTESQSKELLEKWIRRLTYMWKEDVPFRRNIPSDYETILDGYPYDVYQDCVFLYESCYFAQYGIFEPKELEVLSNLKVKAELQKLVDVQPVELPGPCHWSWKRKILPEVQSLSKKLCNRVERCTNQ